MILLKEFDFFKNSGCHGYKTEKYWKSLKIYWSETIAPRATKFGMYIYPINPLSSFFKL